MLIRIKFARHLWKVAEFVVVTYIYIQMRPSWTKWGWAVFCKGTLTVLARNQSAANCWSLFKLQPSLHMPFKKKEKKFNDLNNCSKQSKFIYFQFFIFYMNCTILKTPSLSALSVVLTLRLTFIKLALWSVCKTSLTFSMRNQEYVV